jgi:hypothetical protein
MALLLHPFSPFCVSSRLWSLIHTALVELMLDNASVELMLDLEETEE